MRLLKGAKKAPFSLFFSIGIGFELLVVKKTNYEQNNYLQSFGNDGKDFQQHQSGYSKPQLLC